MTNPSNAGVPQQAGVSSYGVSVTAEDEEIAEWLAEGVYDVPALETRQEFRDACALAVAVARERITQQTRESIARLLEQYHIGHGGIVEAVLRGDKPK